MINVVHIIINGLKTLMAVHRYINRKQHREPRFFFPDLQTVIPRPNVGLFFNVPWEFLPRQYCIHVPCILSLFFFFFFLGHDMKSTRTFIIFLFSHGVSFVLSIETEYITTHSDLSCLPLERASSSWQYVRTFMNTKCSSMCAITTNHLNGERTRKITM